MVAIRRFVLVFLAFGGLISGLPKLAFSASFDNELDEKPWQELETQLPEFPESENLIPFEADSISGARFLIDEKSISVGSDGVIRYALVAISSTGAQNISFEGMRCATGERRVYAFGRSDKTWSRARSSAWTSRAGGSNSHRVALFSDYFCAIGEREITTPEDAIRALRYGVQRAAP
jgi:hypothetical protein